MNTEINIDTLYPRLRDFVSAMINDPDIANALRVPKGYGTLRRLNLYSGFTNWQAIQMLIQSAQESWPGVSFDYPEITELFEKYKED